MTQLDMVIGSDRVALPGVGVRPAQIGIRQGRIAGVYQPGEAPAAKRILDLGDKVVMPGIIEAHSHMQMYRWTPEEEFRSETFAAALGGVTTLMTYLIQSQPYEELFSTMCRAADANALANYAFHFALTSEAQVDELPRYITEFGVTSFKFFMSFRGEEGAYLGAAGIDDGLLYRIMSILGQYPGTLLCPHTENIEIVWQMRGPLMESGRNDLAAWEETRPPLVEAEAIQRVLFLSRATNCGVYVVHVSSADGLAVLERERHSGLRVYIETCPHYLLLHKHSELGSIAKVNPPVRAIEHTEVLWKALLDGTVDVLASDHVVRPRETKDANIWKASAGFPGVATTLPILLSEGVNRRGMSIERVVDLMSTTPARAFGMYPRKGVIAPGADADLTVVDLDYEEVVDGSRLGPATGYSPYDGLRLKGFPVMTIVGGEVVMEDRQIIGTPGIGRYVHRGARTDGF